MGDLIEHVRTVHFALMVACFALLLAVFADNPSAAKRANQQAHSIVKALSNWNVGFLEQYAKTIVDDRNIETTRWFDSVFLVRFGPLLDVPSSISEEAPKDPFERSVRIRTPGWSLVDSRMYPGQNSPDLESGQFSIDVPKDLQTFKKLWNRLAEECRILIPMKMANIGAVGKNYRGTFLPREWLEIVRIHEPPKEEGVEGAIILMRDEWFENVRQHAKSPYYTHALGIKDTLMEIYFWSDLNEEHQAVLIPLAVHSESFDGQQALLDSLSVDWTKGSFDQTFPELAAATEGFPQIGLADVERLLEAQRKQTAERFQAFGVEMPSNLVGTWGLPVVVFIAVYFLLHLRTLARMFQSNVSDFAPWIGIYDENASRIVTLISACGFPITTSLIVIYRFNSIEIELGSESWMMLWVSAISLGIIAAFTLLAFKELWKASGRKTTCTDEY